jgi:dUTP pyrophosphatase
MTKIDVRVKRLHADAVIPKYAHEYDAGFDLVAVEDVIIEPGETKLVPTGLAFQIPIGYEIQIRPRSGVSLKTKLRVSNAPGTIDSQYRGEVKVIVDNIRQRYIDEDGEEYVTRTLDTINSSTEVSEFFTEGTYIIRKGDKIAQGVLAEVPRANFVVVDELDETTRGESGFGSTGVNG